MLLEDKIEMLIGVEDLTTMLQRKTNNWLKYFTIFIAIPTPG
jgi:hypothetical protein